MRLEIAGDASNDCVDRVGNDDKVDVNVSGNIAVENRGDDERERRARTALAALGVQVPDRWWTGAGDRKGVPPRKVEFPRIK